MVPEAWPTGGELRAVLEAMVGTQQQRPPAFSAKHVDGVRSHRLARRGMAVDLAPVEVTIHAIELLAWQAPDAEFRVTVSPGTYVRAIARDVGARLGTGAHLVALRRESIGTLQVDDALPLEAIDAAAVQAPLAVLGDMPRLELDEAQRAFVRHGRAIARGREGGEDVVALVQAGELVAVAEVRGDQLQPVVVLGG
jgi:tRNA pseudouridine55 synthase